MHPGVRWHGVEGRRGHRLLQKRSFLDRLAGKLAAPPKAGRAGLAAGWRRLRHCWVAGAARPIGQAAGGCTSDELSNAIDHLQPRQVVLLEDHALASELGTAASRSPTMNAPSVCRRPRCCLESAGWAR
jgi:hypothetical protein